MKWDLTYLYQTEEDFLKTFDTIKEQIAKIGEYQGKLNDDENFKNYFLAQKELEKQLLRTYQYASLKSDQNKKDVQSSERLSRCMMLLSLLQEATSFEAPEILSLGKERVFEIVNKYDELKEFSFGLEKLFRSNEHVLDAKSERLLSFYEPIFDSGRSLYSTLAVADHINQKVKLSDKKEVIVTQNNWTSLIEQSSSSKDRKKIFEALYQGFENHKNTFGEIYNKIMATEYANIKARNYKSILESHLFSNNIPESVYLNLVRVAGKETKGVKKYIKLRKKILNLKKYHTYDRFLPLAYSDKKYFFEDALRLFYKSIEKMPQDFQNKAREALKEGFVDVYEQDGKRSGAYSSSMPDLHPFILLNYTSSLDDVFTVAHEAGHSIHSLYAHESQPATLQNYTIFVAEIASTFNEHMLLDYLVKSEEITKEEKISLLQKAIDEIMGTFYRQALFAEYELEASRLAEKQQPINYQVLSEIMIKLYKKYYGLDIRKEKVKQYVWAYIPHLFYTPFYVYQYATSFSASFKIYNDVIAQKDGALDRYFNLLRSGGSMYPMEQTKLAGVDLSKKETFKAVVERLDVLVNQLEELTAN